MNKECFNYFEFIDFNGAKLHTSICLPKKEGKFPTVIMRTPYVDSFENTDPLEMANIVFDVFADYVKAGYALVYQHCRGRGLSSGDCIPYINEREDGLNLQEWVRHQSFYNGEIYLSGGSYTSSVHFVTAPFADDIKGAVLQVQDTERYNCNYRNGFYKVGLHGGWYVGMYKNKTMPKKNYVPESYNLLPLSDFSKSVFGENAADFDEILRHPDKNDPFWDTRFGGGEARHAVKNAKIPILLVTGFYDIFTGGVFDMWKELDESRKSSCALLVHPYDHGNYAEGQPIVFDDASTNKVFGNYAVKWLDHIRGKCDSPIEKGKVTYYKVFGNEWCIDDFETPKKELNFSLGEGERTYVYNPFAPATFKGGLSANFGGNCWQDEPNSRYDILSFFTPEFDADTFVKGKMKVKLRVRSDCEDTCFYVRLSLTKNNKYYGLRDDINQISNFTSNYIPGDAIDMSFEFDEHAFVVKKGEKIRIDISSSAFPLYVRHTNNKGLFSTQTTAKIAKNTIILNESSITLFVE